MYCEVSFDMLTLLSYFSYEYMHIKTNLTVYAQYKDRLETKGEDENKKNKKCIKSLSIVVSFIFPLSAANEWT